MTFDPSRGHLGVTGVKLRISFKVLLLLQTTRDDDMLLPHDWTLVGVYGVYTEFGSKVIKGSLPAKLQKITKNFKKSYLLNS